MLKEVKEVFYTWVGSWDAIKCQESRGAFLVNSLGKHSKREHFHKDTIVLLITDGRSLIF